jgi:hypothetical protein
MTVQTLFDGFAKKAIARFHRDCMSARTDQRHFGAHHRADW